MPWISGWRRHGDPACSAHLSPDETVVRDRSDQAQMRPVELARRIGWVSQGGELSRMRLIGVIRLGRNPHFRWEPIDTDFRAVEDAIRFMGFEDIACRYVDELSRAEFQLVQIIRAFVPNPGIILFDEPERDDLVPRFLL